MAFWDLHWLGNKFVLQLKYGRFATLSNRAKFWELHWVVHVSLQDFQKSKNLHCVTGCWLTDWLTLTHSLTVNGPLAPSYDSNDRRTSTAVCPSQAFEWRSRCGQVPHLRLYGVSSCMFGSAPMVTKQILKEADGSNFFSSFHHQLSIQLTLFILK